MASKTKRNPKAERMEPQKGEHELSVDQPEPWEHDEPGDQIAGRVGPVRKGKFTSYRIVSNSDGNFYLNGSAGLQGLMDEGRVPVGSSVRVVFTGFQKIQGQTNPMKTYRVFLGGSANGNAESDDLPF